MERRSEAEVCTNGVRKMRVPLARARDGVPQEGLVTWLGAERRRSICFVLRPGVAGGNGLQEVGVAGRQGRPQQGGAFIPFLR